MEWDLQERVEDAFVALVATFMDSDMKAYPAFSNEKLQYPCVVINAGDLVPISDESEWYDVLKMEGTTVAVMTEAAPTKDRTGNIVLQPRERNAKARESVLGGLIGRDLADRLNATQTPGVLFSQAQVSGVSRDVVDEPRMFITLISLDVIAEPVELS